jgi:hypothetical protein
VHRDLHHAENSTDLSIIRILRLLTSSRQAGFSIFPDSFVAITTGLAPALP